MNVSNKIFLLFFSLFLSSQSYAGPADEGISNITLKTTHVRGNIYMLEGEGGFAGGNIGVSAGPDGLLLVDDQLGPMSKKLMPH